MKFKALKIGTGAPHIAIVGSDHGDEILGTKVIDELKNLKLKQGSMSFIVAHPTAIDQNKRFIKYDLNRSFPGTKNGQHKLGLAYKINQYLKSCDIVIDIHSTNANISSLTIVTRFDKKTKKLLQSIPIEHVALARKKVFGGHELISHHPLAVSLDYGTKKDSRALKVALAEIKQILQNLKIISGPVKLYPKKQIYVLTEQYTVPHTFKYTRQIHELQLIQHGDIIGYSNNQAIAARYNFYPLFLHDGRYEGTFALAAKKRVIVS